MGLERAANDIICSGVARDFFKCVDRARRPRFDGSGGKYSRTRAAISSGGRSSDRPSFESRVLPRNRQYVSRRRRTRSEFAKLSPIAIRRTPGEPACDARAIGEFLRFSGNLPTSRCRGCEYSTDPSQVDILVGSTLLLHVHRVFPANGRTQQLRQ